METKPKCRKAPRMPKIAVACLNFLLLLFVFVVNKPVSAHFRQYHPKGSVVTATMSRRIGPLSKVQCRSERNTN